MNRTQALAIAADACAIYKHGDSWMLRKPWKATDPRGPTTTVQLHYYRWAQRRLAMAIADVALAQMLEGEDLHFRVEAHYAMALESEHRGGSAKALLAIGLKAAKEYKEKV